MFTGIIETLGTVSKLVQEKGNLHITISSELAADLKIDQSVAHNGVCLTVVSCSDSEYTVTAIEETLAKTALGDLKVGALVNLERAMILGTRLDGHIVQGHVDQVGSCTSVVEHNGSWEYCFTYDPQFGNVTIEKGSITVDGTSLTVVHSKAHSFCVAIIPYTHENTRFKTYQEGSRVNLEFDVIGKYVAKLIEKN